MLYKSSYHKNNFHIFPIGMLRKNKCTYLLLSFFEFFYKNFAFTTMMWIGAKRCKMEEVFDLSYSFEPPNVDFKLSSSCCSSLMVAGQSIIISRPWLFFGNAMKSRIELSPFITAHSLSNPKAMPPCGGAPYSNAPNKNPNCSSASSLLKPNKSKF